MAPAPHLQLGGIALIVSIMACRPTPAAMPDEALVDFASRYTAAWCSQDPAKVADFFADAGSLTINAGTPTVGRPAITAAAQGFMTAFPDLLVTMDSVVAGAPGQATYYWTLTGTNTGPGGTGRPVRISGHEEWTFNSAGLVQMSIGHFDADEYQRQLAGSASPR